MSAPRADEVLWSAVVRGDESAAAELFDRHRDLVLGRARALLHDAADAEDALAIVFLEAWRHRRSLRFVDGSMAPWLLVTTTNVSRNIARAGRRYRRLLATLHPASEVESDPCDAVGDRLDSVRRWGEIAMGAGTIDPLDEAILKFCVVEGVPVAQAAASLGLPVGTVKSRLFRVKAKLRRGQGSDPD